MNADILARIRFNLATLSPAEAAVAEWVLDHPRTVAADSIAQVAASVGVSEPTIIRFCRSLGLAGFRELRTQLFVSVQHPDSFLHRDVEPTDGVSEAAGKVLDTSVRALVNLRSVAATMPFEAATAAMTDARALIFVGLGASGLVACDAAHKFFRLGIPCSTATDFQTITQSAAIAREADVYIAVSHTGTWPELVSAMTMAKDNGAHVLAITDPAAPLAAVAHLTFESHPAEDTKLYTPMSSRLVQLALLDALQVGLALALGERAAQNLKRSKDALLRYRSVAR